MKISTIKFLIGLLGCQLLLASCTLGPQYVRPAMPEKLPATFREQEGWKLANPGDDQVTEHWWEIYNDPVLNSLEEQVPAANLSVAAAAARLRQARAAWQGASSGYFPTVTAGVSASRSKRSASLGSANNSGATSSDFQLPLDVAWELDLWGKVRRATEAGQAAFQASRADLDAITLSARAELAVAYYQLRTLDAQKQLLEATIAAYRKSLELTGNRYAAGVAAKTDVLQAETQLKSTQAQAIDLGIQRAKLEHAIALLIGKTPTNFTLAEAPLAGAIPSIPAGLPSQLLERRPDIASAERRVAEANAQIGITKAAYFPTVRLSAAAGFEASTLASWFAWPSRFWSVGPALAATIFDGGLRQSQSEQVMASYDATVAAYRETVLTGFQEVEDNLAALRILEEEANLQDQALQAAQQAVKITTNQYQSGTVAYLNVLVAQTTALANERSALSILGRRLVASVLLVKALGGGWNRPDYP